jgi:transcriptional regulator with XRE-family HTH domain
MSDDTFSRTRQIVGVSKLKDMPYLIECGKRLALARQALGFDTIRAFAAAINRSEDALTSWEAGKNRIPDYLLRQLKSEFGITTDFILTGDKAGLRHDLILALARLASGESAHEPADERRQKGAEKHKKQRIRAAS